MEDQTSKGIYIFATFSVKCTIRTLKQATNYIRLLVKHLQHSETKLEFSKRLLILTKLKSSLIFELVVVVAVQITVLYYFIILN